MAKEKQRKHPQPDTPEPPQIMDPQSVEEREKKKQPISEKKKGRQRKRPGRKNK